MDQADVTDARRAMLAAVPEPRLWKIVRTFDEAARRLDPQMVDAHDAVLDELERRHPEIEQHMMFWLNEEDPNVSRAQAISDAVEGTREDCLRTLVDVAFPPQASASARATAAASSE